jgi:hypothetical protein
VPGEEVLYVITVDGEAPVITPDAADRLDTLEVSKVDLTQAGNLFGLGLKGLPRCEAQCPRPIFYALV